MDKDYNNTSSYGNVASLDKDNSAPIPKYIKLSLLQNIDMAGGLANIDIKELFQSKPDINGNTWTS